MNDAPPTGRALWIAGARPRTLPAAVVPVAVGAACAVGEGVDAWWRAIFALIVALALQVGVNYANDYSDGVRGTDDERRVGPLRLVGSGLAPAASVKRAAQISFATAGVFGGVLALVVGPELLVVGALSIIAGWTYTGGPKPYGYLGLGEIFVFVFFGVVATVGTTYVLLEEVQTLSLVASVAVGLWATALLVINNLRDIPGDTDAGKNTLAVRIGARATRIVFAAMHVAALGFALWAAFGFGRWGGLMVVLGLGQMIQAVVDVQKGATGPELVKVLGLTASVQMVSGLGFRDRRGPDRLTRAPCVLLLAEAGSRRFGRSEGLVEFDLISGRVGEEGLAADAVDLADAVGGDVVGGEERSAPRRDRRRGRRSADRPPPVVGSRGGEVRRFRQCASMPRRSRVRGARSHGTPSLRRTPHTHEHR